MDKSITKICLTVDMEQDCPPFLTGFRGVIEGTPRLLQLFRKENVKATFFTTGEVARKFPDTIKQIINDGHELGCHGDTHKKFIDMEAEEAQFEIKNSTATLRQFYPVVSFRAPNLVFPQEYLKFLEAENYQLDSSEAKYKRSYYQTKKTDTTTLARIPASATSSVHRIPKVLRWFYFSRLTSPVVLFVHPWEFVDLRREKLRWDCRFRTGTIALNCLKENITYYRKKNGSQFLRMQDLIHCY